MGFVSDDHIDVLRAKRRIALIYSERDGPISESREGLKAAFLLGATRMSRITALPVDSERRVLPETIDALPLVLRVRIERLALPFPIPLARLVEKTIPLGATIEDAEVRGRLVVLSRIAVGAGLADIEDEAERCAASIADRTGCKAHADGIVGQMLDQLAKDRSRLQ